MSQFWSGPTSAGVSIGFDMDFAKWQRDFRYKTKFFLRAKFERRMEDMKVSLKNYIKDLAPKASGDLANSVDVIVNQADSESGVFNFTFGPTVSYAKFVEYGRGPGPAPWARISEWVEIKFGSADPKIIAGVRRKLASVGFNDKLAPYHFMELALQAFIGGDYQRILNEVGLDAELVFNRGSQL